MFHTFPEAELTIPVGLSDSNGVKVFHWVELSLQIPYFLAAISVDIDDLPCTKHLLCSDLDQIVSITRSELPGVKLGSVCVLCPGYMTGSGTYQSEEIIEVWGRKGSLHDQIYVTKDGRKLEFCLDGEPMPEREMELILSIAA